MPHPASSRDQRNTIWDTVKLGGVLKKELGARLRSRHRMRHAQNTSRARQPRGRIIDGISIRDHPADVEDPATPDHWEGDLITGSQNTHISYFGGQSVAPYPVREGEGERHHQRGDGTEHADTTIATDMTPVINMESRNGIVPAQTIDGRYHGACLFL